MRDGESLEGESSKDPLLEGGDLGDTCSAVANGGGDAAPEVPHGICVEEIGEEDGPMEPSLSSSFDCNNPIE